MSARKNPDDVDVPEALTRIAVSGSAIVVAFKMMGLVNVSWAEASVGIWGPMLIWLSYLLVAYGSKAIMGVLQRHLDYVAAKKIKREVAEEFIAQREKEKGAARLADDRNILMLRSTGCIGFTIDENPNE